MKITIEVLDTGHLIEVVTSDGIKRHSCGKWHAVCSILKGYLYKREDVPKKEIKKKKKL